MVEHQTSESLKNAKGNVTFEQVSFGYTLIKYLSMT